MKRTMWGSLILLVLLIGGLVVSFGMRAVHSDICRLLQQAEAAAEGEDWQNATSLAKEAQLAWEKHHAFTASFADHNPMDELDGLFAELMVYMQNRESPHFSATCARLAVLAKSMADSHGLQWWNVL